MATVMNMSGYEIDRTETQVDQYADDVMNAGWNPQLSLMSICASARAVKNNFMTPALAEVDVDAFLRVMYTSQR